MSEANLSPIIKDSFIQYAGAVLQSRALVDVRDGLKPSARQIFYCLYTDKFLPNKPFKKTLKAIGSVARMYIHGDSSAEGVIMRAGQNFAMRYPLVEVNGNAGTLILSGNWAAPRYTESRLSNFSVKLFEDIDKETISEWRDNYDNTEQYPSVLPTKGFYNLVNGTMGIGIGAASSIPSFNLKEMNKALETLLLNPDASFEEIYCAPDFATGGTLLNEEEVKASLEEGQGNACKLRSTIEFDRKERVLIVTEIPYGVYTNTICGELEKILESESNPGIDRFNDLTGETPLIKIYLNKNSNPDRIIKYLYKNTSLQSFYGINMTMLDDGRFPRIFKWKEALQAHINHEKEVYKRGFEFDLNKIKARIHIIEGLLKAYDVIDEVILTIKSSESSAAATVALCKLLIIDEIQAKAILDLKLSKLSKIDITKLLEEKNNLEKEKNRIEEILINVDLFNKELIKGWRAVSEKYGDERRTKILNISSSEEEPVEIKQLSLSFTNEGGVFVEETSSLYSQRRNGIGQKFKLDKGEFVVNNLVGNTTDEILFFTSKGDFYHYNLSNFNVGEKQYPTEIANLKIVNAEILSKNNDKKFIIFATKNGIIKKSALSEYNLKRGNGAAAIKLDPGDEIVSVEFINDEKIGWLTKKGQFVLNETKGINSIGRVTRGVVGIKLNDGDEVVSMRSIPSSTKEILSITADGYSKRVSIDEFTVTGRATKGVKMGGNELIDFLPISDNSDILITASSTQIRVKLNEFTLLGRGAQGTKAIKISDTNKIINLSKI